MDLIELGLRVKQCRKNQNFTQEKLAEVTNVTPHYIYEIEKGLKMMSLSTLTDLSTALNTTTDYLLFGASSLPDTNADRLNNLTKNLSMQKRESIADILEVTIPLLK